MFTLVVDARDIGLGWLLVVDIDVVERVWAGGGAILVPISRYYLNRVSFATRKDHLVNKYEARRLTGVCDNGMD